MQPTFKKLVCAALFSLAVGAEAFAIKANPKPISVKLPDGTTISIRLHGNENFHYTTTIDGYLIQRSRDGFFRYMDYDAATGQRRPTTLRVSTPDRRTAEEQAYLSRTTPIGKTLSDLGANAPGNGLTKPLLRAPRTILPQQVRCRKPARLADTAEESQYLVILVNFQDVKCQHTAIEFDNWLNEAGYSANGATGSVKDYYRDNSTGQFVPNFTVIEPIELDNDLVYYAENSASDGGDVNPREMVREACEKAKALYPDLDFRRFDNDGDGWMDNCYIIYAGYSEASTGNDDDMWPHSWNMGDDIFEIDGIKIDNYSCSAELVGASGNAIDGIGTFTHEFGHILGLKDMYDTDDYTDGYGLDPGDYCLYASGSYNNDSRTPAGLMAFERMQMGWLTPTELKAAEDVTLAPLSENVARYIDAQPHREAGTGEEWFFFENRQQTGWDRYIPAHGLLIYHYDHTDEMVEKYWDYNGPNNNARHRCMYIVAADNIDDATSRNGDTFPGRSGNTSFTDDTTPACRNWANEGLGIPVTNIREEDGNVLFQICGGIETPAIIRTFAPTVADISDKSVNISAKIESTTQEVLTMGFCWGLDDFPTVENDELIELDVAPEVQTTLLGLIPGTNYYVRAFMQLEDGSFVYGASIPFRTECQVAKAPYVGDFRSWTNGELDCWKIVDHNGDGSSWTFDKNTEAIVYVSDYWNNADDWLVSSRMKVPSRGALFFVRGVTDMTSVEQLDVYVSTRTREVEDFHLVKRFSFADNFGTAVPEEVDLSDYAGQEIYVALVCSSEKLQSNLWLWQVYLTQKLETPAVTRFTLEGEHQLKAEWTEVDGAVKYMAELSEVTETVNNGAIFVPESDYELVEGDVDVQVGNLTFTGSGSVTTREYPDGITNCMFYLTSSGPVGTSVLTIEGTEDGEHWETVGPITKISSFDSEGQEMLLENYFEGKTYKRMRVSCAHGGRNLRLRYFTLCYNDGTVWNTLASGTVDGASLTIDEAEENEFTSGKKYALQVYAGDGLLYYDASTPAFFQYDATGISGPECQAKVSVRLLDGWLQLSGLEPGARVTVYTAAGVAIRSLTAPSERVAIRLPEGSGPWMVKTDGSRGIQTQKLLRP